MNKTEFPFRNVRELNAPDTEIVAIEFTLYQHTFYVSVFKPSKRRNYYKPSRVFHTFSDSCPHCQADKRAYGECGVLSQSTMELFHALIEQPSIRLEWLFREYE